MTTLMPSRSDAHSYDTLNDERLATALHPWHNRLVLQYVLRWLVGGVLVGMALAGLVLIIARLTPWAAAPSWAGGLILAFALAAPMIALWLRPSTEGTAHIVDSKLQLQDRISTAWEMRDQKATLAVLQRRDALQQLKQYAPTTTIDLRPGRSTLIALAVVIMALVLLIVLPNPMNDVLRQQEAFQTKVAQQVKAITKVRQDLVHQPDLPQTQQQQVDQILSDLQAKLQQARNENEAQQAIADAQAKLNQLRDPQATNKIQGQAAAGSSLQGSSNKNLQSAGQALSNNNSKALAQALQDLANQAGKLSAAQRSQLSQQIEQAANQANQNPNLSSALHQLAKSLADGNQSEINDAANAVNAAAQQDASTQAQEQGIGKASQNLQQSANALASSTDSSTSKQQGQQGQGQNQGQGQQGQQGQGQNQGQGQQGQQGQNGRGQNQGQGQGQGQGQQGGQGKGGQGGSNGAGSQQGKTEQVYVPGQTGSGASTQSNDNTSGVVQQGSSVPYSQVVQQYNQQAHDAIDNSNAPPDVKDLVHNYFDALEGQQ